MISRATSIAAKVAGMAAFLIGWEAANRSLGPYWVPSVAMIAERAASEWERGALMADFAATLVLFLVGSCAGLVFGVTIACLLRLSRRVDLMLQPFITAIMSIPKLGLVPLLVLWFGTGWLPKAFLVGLTVLFIVFSLTYSGLVTVQPKLVMAARLMGASSFQVTRSIVLPTVLPFVLTGLEVSLPWAVSAALVAEYLSSKVGIGHVIEQSKQMSDSVGVFYGITLATVLVLVFNAALAVVRNLSVKGR